MDMEKIKESIIKPLLFASKDGFAHMGNVVGLEELIVTLSDKAISVDKKLEKEFSTIKTLFNNFDNQTDDKKKTSITEALSLLDGKSTSNKKPIQKTTKKIKPPAKVTVMSEKTLTLYEAEKNFTHLDTPLQFMKGIGPKLSERLSKKKLNTIEDLLYYLPLRYEDRSRSAKIGRLEVGSPVSGVGEVVIAGEARYGKRKVFEVVITDGSGLLKLKWFHYRVSYMKKYKEGQWLRFFGTATLFGKQKEIIHPDLEVISKDDGEDVLAALGDSKPTSGSKPTELTPVYSQIDNMHQKTMRKFVDTAIDGYMDLVVSGSTIDGRKSAGVMDLGDSLLELHRPKSSDSDLAKKSLVFDELFMLELGLAMKRKDIKKEGGVSFTVIGKHRKTYMKSLPFTLTNAQLSAVKEIDKDMSTPHPMNRLVQGDVGSGKTVVSFLAMLNAVDSGYQAAMMAPTEILATQHYELMKQTASELGIKAILLKGSMTGKDKKLALEEISSGVANVIIGTHALIQKDVEFFKLGLAVIDEQHRFGVEQRAEIKRKAGLSSGDTKISPDILVMTATPIPRTLSITVFGDLDVTTIDEMPKGREPITTNLLWDKDREKAYSVIRDEVNKGRQVYIVYPLVEESEELDLKDATQMKEHLEKDIFPDLKLSLLHGRMKSSEKESVMNDFKNKKSDILVATTVIEVGIDIPNATVMLIEHAERFGLSQLHQLRGRVGRGSGKSRCILLAQHSGSDDTKKRLKVMIDTNDGFKIAKADLEIRGPGDFLGTRQSGLPDFRTPGVLGDLNILKIARGEVFKLLEIDPDLKSDEGLILREVLRRRWAGRLELSTVG